MEEESHLDDLLKAAFGDEGAEGESVLERIEQASGTRPRILLRDDGDSETPVLRPPNERGGHHVCPDGRYQFLGEIARGGIGIIQKGHDRNLGRSVALKVLRKEHMDDEDIRTRFIEEAQIGGQLQHPGIVPVYGVGLEGEGRPYFAMQLVKGETLAALLEDRASPAEGRRRFLAFFEHIAQTVAYAHARGVVHRDLKPSNVMIGRFGEVLVVDWGLAKVLGSAEAQAPQHTIISTVRTEAEGSASLVGSVMGTPAYMPPEQALGHVEALDERSDVFALGALLTEILTGLPPYTGDSKDCIVMAAQARLDDAYQRLDASGADEGVIELAKECMQAVPGDRPRNAGVVAREIGQHLTEAEERARRAETDAAEAKVGAEEERGREATERHRLEQERAKRRQSLFLATGVLAVALAGVIGWLLKDRADGERAAAAQPLVAAAMLEADGHGGAGAWSESLAAASKAVALATTHGAAPTVQTQAEALLKRLTTEAEAAADAKQVAAEDDVLIQRLLDADTDDDYTRAFRGLGIDMDVIPAEDVAAWLLTRPRAKEIARDLDTWARLRRFDMQRPARDWTRLLEVARVADPDPLRDRLRDPAFGDDAKAPRQLIADTVDDDLPAATADLLGMLLGEHDMDEAISYLRHAHLSHPGDIRLNLHLGALLSQGDEARQQDARRYLLAADVLRATVDDVEPRREGK